MDVRPFQIAVSDSQLEDLRARLRSARWPTPLSQAGWDDGAARDVMGRLIDYWRDQFDWRAQERRLNALPQFMAEIDGSQVHFLHYRGVASEGLTPLPLVITHGWPGSFLEMERLVPLLTDPGGHGGDPADAFDVVVPSLPGYGFSPAPTQPGISPRQIAGLWHRLMQGLGYSRFAAQGGDIGAAVSIWLARDFAGSIVGTHLNYVSAIYQPSLEGAAPLTAAEQRYRDTVAEWIALEGGYSHMHATKPQTLAYALTDSPLGLAAWIVEKFHAWSDCDGDVERLFGFDTLLTDIAIYWFGDAIAGSLRLYKEGRLQPLRFAAGERVAPPMGVAVFPREIPMPPRSWVERVFDVQRWTEMPRGGHFAAIEQPSLLAADIRAFFRPLRGRDGG